VDSCKDFSFFYRPPDLGQLSAVPRKEPLPEREAEVCKRVRDFRLALKLSQITFAKELGEDSSALASIEHMRAPLRWPLGERIVRRFLLNPEWLARGEGPLSAPVFIPKLSNASRLLFTEVFDKHISKEVGARWPLDCRDETGARLYIEAMAQAFVRTAMLHVPFSKLPEFLQRAEKYLSKLADRYDVEPSDVIVKREKELAKRRLLLDSKMVSVRDSWDPPP
jgi:transcriptional regulator with XRE-family HTH domain